ncbi:MAG: outer membrane protein assembly factor BamB [Hyphomicrobiaceae bacterium]|jgi:outer membrane protein assembly factor BamB
MHSLRKATLTAALCGIASLSSGLGATGADEVQKILRESGILGGIVVHLGTSDGKLEAELAGGHKFLVHGLALDQASLTRARDGLIEAGLYGFAAVWELGNTGRLPYADNLVNALIADLDALGPAAPTRQEIMRVIAPGGFARIRSSGRWESVPKPRPPEMDDWTHFDYDATGNAVSKDRLVKPPRQLQWISGVQPMIVGGNPAGFVGSSGVRLSDGKVYSDWLSGGKDSQRYGAWDAFNGIPLWSRTDRFGGRRLYYHSVAADGRVFQFTGEGSQLVAFDGRSGVPLREYEAAGKLPRNGGLACLRYTDGKLLVANRSKLFLIDAASGKLIWTFQDPSESLLFFPVADAAEQRIYAVVSGIKDDTRIEHRWPNSPAEAVVCLDLKTGRELWRCREVAGKRVGQILPNGKSVALFAGGGIGAGKNPFYANLRASDGEMQWSGTFPTEWNRAGYSALWRDGAIFYADPWKIFRLDPKTGEETHVFGSSYNARCMRMCATRDYFFHGFLAYVDKNFTAELQSVARSACANSAFPANGLLYFTPNTCRCFTMLRGLLCLTAEPLADPLPDAQRLDRAGGHTVRHATAAPHPPPSPDKNLLVEHWRAGSDIPGVAAGNPKTGAPKRYALSADGQRIFALDDSGKRSWTFTGGGRIGTPLIYGGNWYLGCRDGYVYALDGDTGSLRWRFHAAPYRRLISAHGQLESGWPVYGAVLHNGSICVSAGRHPEIGGGIYLWGLRPKSGEIVWKRTLRKTPAMLQGTERVERNRPKIIPPSCLNGVLQSHGERLSLPGYRDQPFVFDPHLSNEALTRFLDSPPAKRSIFDQ